MSRQDFPPTLLRLSPRALALGAGSVEALNTTELPEGARVYAEDAQCDYVLRRGATGPADGANLIVPAAGPGRWLPVPSPLAGLTAQYWVDSGYTGSVSTGSLAAPFKTVQAAYDAGVAAGVSWLNILVVASSNAASLVTAALGCSVVGVSYLPLAYQAIGSTPQNLSSLTVGGAGNVQMENMHVLGAISVAAAAKLALGMCQVDGLTTLGDGSTLLLDRTSIASLTDAPTSTGTCVATGVQTWGSSVTCRNLQLDFESEYALLSTAAVAPVLPTFPTITSLEDSPKLVALMGDSNRSGGPRPAQGYSRVAVPANVFKTVSRTWTLTAATTYPYVATFDVYPQSFNFVLFDNATSTNLFSAAVAAPQRLTATWNVALAQWQLTSVALL